MDLFKLLKERIVVSDGAMGTMLQQMGLPVGVPPEIWNLEHPEKIRQVHQSYVESGAQIITTNTFGANRAKLKEYGLASKIKEINQKAVAVARAAAKDRVFVAGSIGPTGKFLRPFGELTFDEAYEIFREQASALAGADVMMIETMIDTLELRAAVLGVKDAMKMQNAKCKMLNAIIAQFSFNDGVRTVTGTDAETACTIFESLGVPIFGANCGNTLKEAIEVMKIMCKHISASGGRAADVFLIAQPNAGVGKNIASPQEMADFAVKAVGFGANIVGSCCGSTPEHTKEIARAVRGMKPIRERRAQSVERRVQISSRTQTVSVGGGIPFLVVGERINPSGKPKLEEALKERRIGVIKEEAVRQVECGANALDVNIGKFDEPLLMAIIFEELQSAVQVPLIIDSQNPKVIEAALKVYAGRGVINSINGREDLCAQILPIAKRYGATVIGLLIDENGIPETASQRLRVAKKLLKLAECYGVKDIIIDPLVLPIGTKEDSAKVAIETVRRIEKELGKPTIFGLSNISYGMPAREPINQAFLVAAIQAGLDAAILDPMDKKLMELVSAGELLSGRDHRSERYIKRFASPYTEAVVMPIPKALLSGNKELVIQEVNKLLISGVEPIKIINEFLIPGIEEAGTRYERKEFFLPQLIGAAEAMREGISILVPLFDKKRQVGKKVLLATVRGDMHDLGKNLVAAILSANGFEVVDIGKDVHPEHILEACKREAPDVVGLSSLMTTTLPALEETVALLKSEYPQTKIIVGGAVVDKEFADSLCVLYAKDPIEAARVLKTL